MNTKFRGKLLGSVQRPGASAWALSSSNGSFRTSIMNSGLKAGAGGDGERETATDAYALYALHGGERPEETGEDGHRSKGFGMLWRCRVVESSCPRGRWCSCV